MAKTLAAKMSKAVTNALVYQAALEMLKKDVYAKPSEQITAKISYAARMLYADCNMAAIRNATALQNFQSVIPMFSVSIPPDFPTLKLLSSSNASRIQVNRAHCQPIAGLRDVAKGLYVRKEINPTFAVVPPDSVEML